MFLRSFETVLHFATTPTASMSTPIADSVSGFIKVELKQLFDDETNGYKAKGGKKGDFLKELKKGFRASVKSTESYSKYEAYCEESKSLFEA